MGLTVKESGGVIKTEQVPEMEISQQVKNFHATLRHGKKAKPSFCGESMKEREHREALQCLSSGEAVAYNATLRIVEQEGGRGPRQPPQVTRKHPGYIRNESGGFFTS